MQFKLKFIHVTLRLVDLIVNVEKLIIMLYVHVYRITLGHLLYADQNVLQILIVIKMKLVVIKNVKIHVPEHVE